jgi:hypothetical protein
MEEQKNPFLTLGHHGIVIVNSKVITILMRGWERADNLPSTKVLSVIEAKVSLH